MKRKVFFGLGVAYIVILVALCAHFVGTTFEAHTITSNFPVQVFVLLSLPFAFGWLSHKS